MSTRVIGVSSTIQTTNRTARRIQDLTFDENSSFSMFSQIMSEVIGALDIFHLRTPVLSCYSGLSLELASF